MASFKKHFPEEQASKWQPLTVAGLFLFLVFMMPGLPGYGWDNGCWIRWTQFIHRQGLRNAYSSDTNYLPLFQYFMWAYGKLCGSDAVIEQRLHYLRIFTLLFEFGGLYIMYRWMALRSAFPLFIIMALSNIAFSYNTLIWGQSDAIWTALMAAALYMAWKGRHKTSALFATLSLCMKLQAIMLFPIWGVLVLNSLSNLQWKMALREIVLMALTAAATIGIIVLPFAFGDAGLAAVWQVVTGSVGKYPLITLSADNMWPLLVPKAGEMQDSLIAFAGLSYKWLGVFTFFTTTALVLLPLVKQMLSQKKRAAELGRLPDRETVWLCGALISLLFFYCSTEMHERYAHAAGIFLTAHAFHTRKWGPYLLFSVAYFLNLEVIMQWLALPNYKTFIFEPRFIASIYGVAILWLAILLWLRHKHVMRSIRHHAAHRAE